MDKGNLLVSVSGKGHSMIKQQWIARVIGTVVMAIGIAVSVPFFDNVYRTAEARLMAEQKTSNSDAISRITSLVAGNTGETLVKRRLAEIKETVEHGRIFVIGVCLIGIVFLWVWGVFYCSRISKNAVRVYENAVEGTSYKNVEFQLAYNEISSVDVIKGNAAIINAGNTKHKIYIMDARKIRDAIVSRKTAA